MYRSDDGGRQWTEVTGGLPSEFGFPMVIHPHDPKTIYVIPHSAPDRRPAHAIDGQARGVAQPRPRRLMAAARRRAAARARVPGGAARDDGDRPFDQPGVYFGTSTGQVFGSTDEGENWTVIADYLPSIWSVEAAVVDAAANVVTVHLPRSLVTLFPDPPPRRYDASADTLGGLVDELDAGWPGMRDRLCEAGPRIREHINVFVDGERERDLGATLAEGADVHVIPAVAGG